MERLKKIFFFILLLCIPLFSSGCVAFFARMVIGSKGIAIPQIVAHLEPVLRDNKISVLGKVVIQNPTESALELDKLYLTIKDENDAVVGQNVFEWELPSVVSKKELEAPVAIDLALETLNKESLTIILKTTVTHKGFGIRIPIESKIALFNLNFLRESITRPLAVNIYTKLIAYSFGQSSINYTLTITNPVSVDLLFEKGSVRIYAGKGGVIAINKLTPTLFKASESSQIKGVLKLGNIFGRLKELEYIRRNPVRVQVSGKLRVPGTDIAMPFKVESLHEVSFSWSRQ
jgi:hypothetical protein